MGTDDVAPWIERFARVGYIAKAILYATVGLFAAAAAVGHGQATDTRGAMTKLLAAPFGQALLMQGIVEARLIIGITDERRLDQHGRNVR